MHTLIDDMTGNKSDHNMIVIMINVIKNQYITPTSLQSQSFMSKAWPLYVVRFDFTPI